MSGTTSPSTAAGPARGGITHHRRTQSWRREARRSGSAGTKLFYRTRPPHELSGDRRAWLAHRFGAGRIGVSATAGAVQTQRAVLDAARPAASLRPHRSPAERPLGRALLSVIGGNYSDAYVAMEFAQLNVFTVVIHSAGSPAKEGKICLGGHRQRPSNWLRLFIVCARAQNRKS